MNDVLRDHASFRFLLGLQVPALGGSDRMRLHAAANSICSYQCSLRKQDRREQTRVAVSHFHRHRKYRIGRVFLFVFSSSIALLNLYYVAHFR